MLQKCNCWPKVLPDDNGIRPLGKPDQCFYCNARVGQEHDRGCTTIYQIVKYRVYMNLDARATESDKGIEVGTFTREDPIQWDTYFCDFHKNDSSWCADNALDTIVWYKEEYKKQLYTHLGKQYPDEDEDIDTECACSALRFEFDKVVDTGPLIEIKDDDEPISIFSPEDK